MARPKLPTGTHRVGMHITIRPAIRDLLTAEARRQGLSISQLIEQLIMASSGGEADR